MFHRWGALVLVLALCAMAPKQAAGQSGQSPRGHKAGGLGQNFPNPFNPETYIPFAVGDTANSCANESAGQLHVVSMDILNVLAQQVATPVVQGPHPSFTTVVPPSALQRPITSLKLACGVYVAYWNGNIRGREAPSGVYVVRMWVDGELKPAMRMMNRK
jgi:hypothetical protein